MTTLLAGIAIVPAQSLHVLLGSQHARYNDPVQRNTLHVQTVHECPAYVTEQQTGFGNQIRYALRHTGIYIIIGAHSHIHQFILSMLGLLPVANRRHAPLLCGHYLHLLQIREAFFIRIHTGHTIIHSLRVDVWKRVGLQGVGHRLHLFIKTTHYGVIWHTACHTWKGPSYHTQESHRGSKSAQKYLFLQSSHKSGNKVKQKSSKIKIDSVILH